MFTFILKSEEGRELGRVARAGNESYLMLDDRTFRFLSQLDSLSYDVLNGEDAEELVHELLRVRSDIGNPDDRRHIDEICRLARRCSATPGSTLLITPFQKPLSA